LFSPWRHRWLHPLPLRLNPALEVRAVPEVVPVPAVEVPAQASNNFKRKSTS
jgi:hypothetical protein